MNRTCRVCKEDKPLHKFPIYNHAKGARRHECQACVCNRTKRYQRSDWVVAPRQAVAVEWDKLFHRGSNCWCCRRVSYGQMLCRTCRGAA